jgi:hypothetical protein
VTLAPLSWPVLQVPVETAPKRSDFNLYLQTGVEFAARRPFYLRDSQGTIKKAEAPTTAPFTFNLVSYEASGLRFLSGFFPGFQTTRIRYMCVVWRNNGTASKTAATTFQGFRFSETKTGKSILIGLCRIHVAWSRRRSLTPVEIIWENLATYAT